MPDRAIPTPPEPHAKYERLIKAAQAEATIKVAVAHPCDEVSLESAVEAARLALIEPILVGPQARIRDVAAQRRARHRRVRDRARSTATIRPPRRWSWCRRAGPKR